VLINLTNNAIKFTDKGEIVVSIRLQQMEQHAAVLRVDVRDTGIGLTPAQRSKLFQAFTQADTSTTRHHGGTGLGLTISKRLVEMMEGEIDLVSEAGVGSTFLLYGPLRPGRRATRQFCRSCCSDSSSNSRACACWWWTTTPARVKSSSAC
jgi:signal transduction histidine kinase